MLEEDESFRDLLQRIGLYYIGAFALGLAIMSLYKQVLRAKKLVEEAEAEREQRDKRRSE